MRGLLAVARREIEEKRFVFLAAAVVSLVPFAVPLVKGMHGSAATEMRDCVALILAATFAAGLAVGLGSTVLASDLAERRIGFYFSRPITGLGLWAGKLGAACLIALGAAAIVYAPTLAVNGGRVVLIDLPQETPAAFFAAVAAMVLLMHAGNIAMRPRSPLLALDLAALVLLTLGVVFLLQQFALAFAIEAFRHAVTTLIAAAAIALVLSGLLAVTRGRSDSRAAHRALSATLWGTLGAAVTAVAFYSAWVFSATPRDLKIATALPASRGTWIMVQGPARGAEPAFLFDTATGRYQRAGADWRWPVLSPDGTQAVWLEPSGPKGPFEAMTWKLTDPGSKPVRTVLSFPGTPAAFLSEHGERLATIAGGLLSIHDLVSGASLGSARIGDERFYPRGFFLDRDRFRLFRASNRESPSVGSRLDILEFDVSTKTLATTGTVEDVDGIAYSTSASGERLLVRERSRLALRDGRSGALIATLAERGPTMKSLGRFVSGGRIVVSVAAGSNVRVEVFAMDGQHERTIPIPARDRISLGGEIAPGKLLVAAGGDSKERENRAIFLADLSSGDVRQVADRLFPVVYLAGWVSNSPNYQPEPGSEATKLFYGPGRSLVHFDPLTGERRVILAGSSR